MESFMFLEQDVSGKCFQKNMVLVLSVIEDFRNGINWMFSRMTWIRTIEKTMMMKLVSTGPGNP